MNETQAMPAPGTYFATNTGTVNDPLGEVTAYAAMDIKHEIWKAESDVQKAIQVQTNLINANNLNLHNRLCESEKAAIEAKYEARLEVKDAVTKLNDKIDVEAQRTNDKVQSFRTDVEHHFCGLERRIDDKFCDLEKRELQETICALKNQLTEATSGNTTSSILAGVKSLLGK